MWAYVERRQELDKALEEYDGYSPGYHFSRQINERNEAERAVEDALRDAVFEAMAAGERAK